MTVGNESNGARPTPSLVSVVMPVRNGAPQIVEQLRALAAQSYRGSWELVIADNGSRDRTLELIEQHRQRLPALRIVDAKQRRGINHARNAGTAAARGELLAFCDADDVADRDWLAALVRAAASADVVAGRLDLDSLNQAGRARAMSPWDAPAELISKLGFLPYAPGGNCAVWAAVARAVGWDEEFAFGSSDIEFSWRAQLRGHGIAVAPDAVMAVRLKGSLRALARQYFAYGRSDPLLYRRFRGQGMPSPAETEPMPSWRELVEARAKLRGAPIHQASWTRAGARKLGRIVGSLERQVLVQ